MPSLKVNDISMFYKERGDGPACIVTHAATVTHEAMSWAERVVRRNGFLTIRPDLRGHGQSENPAPDLHMTRLVADMEEFIYLLGYSTVHGFGYSLGGGVLLNTALERPGLFRSLVIIASNYRFPTHERVLQAIGPMERWTPAMNAVFHPEKGAAIGWDKPLEAFAQVPCPSLIIAPDRDQFNDVEDLVALYRVLPNAELLVLPKMDHYELVNHPLILEALDSFYSRVPKTQGPR
ncbi:MAG: alpha/beta hydrolase [Chloroflexi bacterium]|nr:alpha/beta hydrolase [Chloroflexota bacterium]